MVHRWRMIVLILVCAGICGAASAVVITESPSQLASGEPITIQITGLPNSSDFSLLIGATLQVTPGQEFLFETTNFVMPINLDNGQISATTTNAQKASFSAQKGGTEISVTRAADANGLFSFSQAQAIPAGTFDYIRMQGTSLPGKSTIVSSIQLRGKKSGPDSSSISFSVNGIDNGRIQLSIFVDGSPALYKTVTIGNGVPSDEPVIGPTSTTSTPLSGTLTATPTPGSTGNSSRTTFFSADRSISLTAQGVDYAGLVTVDAARIPDTWIPVSDVYAISPAYLTFSPAATLSFTIPGRSDTAPEYAYFIGTYQNGGWVMATSTAQDNAVTTDIDRAGIYGLMAFAVDNGVSSGSATTPEGTVSPAGTPGNTSGVSETTTIPATTKTPPGLLPVFGALATGAAIVLRNRK